MNYHMSEHLALHLRSEIEARILTDAVQSVVDGGDLCNGRCSRLEFLVDINLQFDAEALESVIWFPDGDYAERLRTSLDARVREYARKWLTETDRGKAWVKDQVDEGLQEAIEMAEEGYS